VGSNPTPRTYVSGFPLSSTFSWGYANLHLLESRYIKSKRRDSTTNKLLNNIILQRFHNSFSEVNPWDFPHTPHKSLLLINILRLMHAPYIFSLPCAFNHLKCGITFFENSRRVTRTASTFFFTINPTTSLSMISVAPSFLYLSKNSVTLA